MKAYVEILKFNINDVVATSNGGTGCTPPDTALPCMPSD